MQVTPSQLLKHEQQRKSANKSKAARLAFKRKRKENHRDIISTLATFAALSSTSHICFPPYHSIAQLALNYMNKSVLELKDMCRMNRLMVSGAKTTLVMRLLRCEHHGSPGSCTVCGYSKLEFEYLDDDTPNTLPITVVCKHFYGLGRKCAHGRKSVHASTYPYLPMIFSWKESTSSSLSSSSSSSSSSRKRRRQLHREDDDGKVTVVNGYKNVVYLNVSYQEKGVVKQMGARWDADNKLWYVPLEHQHLDFTSYLPSKTIIVSYSQKEKEDDQDKEDENPHSQVNEYPSTYD